MSRRFLVCFILLLSLCVSRPSLAMTGKEVEEFAERYVLAVESGDFQTAIGLSAGAAVSWAEYMEAFGTYRQDPVRTVSCESIEFSGYWLVKVVFQDRDGDFGARYVRVSRSEEFGFSVIDDGRRGRGWASDSFMPGIIFKEPLEIDGLRITVQALLELPGEIKFDILMENRSDTEIAIYPQLEAYYTVETTRVRKTHYYPIAVKDNDIDGPIQSKSSKRGFLLFPKFVADFADDPSLEGLRWVLYIPYGVDKQFAIER